MHQNTRTPAASSVAASRIPTGPVTTGEREEAQRHRRLRRHHQVARTEPVGQRARPDGQRERDEVGDGEQHADQRERHVGEPHEVQRARAGRTDRCRPSPR